MHIYFCTKYRIFYRNNLYGAPTYVYQYNWKSPAAGGKFRAGHGTEIPLVFNSIEYGKEISGDGNEVQAIADMMSDVWIAFAWTGNPNTKKVTNWKQFDLKNRPTMILDLQPRLENDPRGKERKLFAPVTYVQPGTQ
jgi:para-nitrobenzyl esterase